MAVKYRRQYTNEAEYILDVAKGSDLFRTDTFNALDDEQAIDYSYAVAGTKNKKSDTFNINNYDMLGAEDKFVYLMNEYYADKNTEEYKKTEEYINQRLESARNKMTFESLSELEKIFNSGVGIIERIIWNAEKMVIYGTCIQANVAIYT